MKKKNFEKPMIKFLKLEQTGVICASEGPGPSPSPTSLSSNQTESYSVQSTANWFPN